MGKDLEVVWVEDSEEDILLCVRILQREGYKIHWTRVDTPHDLRTALDQGSCDVIFSDFTMPHFNATEALSEVKRRGLDTPFIIISGTIGEERAVEAMRAGASDYIVKGQWNRLLPVLERELREVDTRRAHRHAEERLRTSQDLQDRILRALPVALYAAKAMNSHQITWVSENMERVSGFSAARFTDDPRFWASRIHPDTRDRVLEEMAQTVKHGTTDIEYQWMCADDSYHWFYDHRVLFRSEEGQPQAIIGTWLDITDRKLLEEKLQVSQRMEAVGRLAGGVAHDFNNILTVINGYSQLLLKHAHGNEDLRSGLDGIYKAGERAANLTRQLLAFSRKQVIHPKVLDLNFVVRDISKMLRRLIGEDVELALKPFAGLGSIKADPGQVEQVLMNLATNARDAMPMGGTLTITTSNADLDEAFASKHPPTRPGSYIQLTVTDTGIGMNAATLKRIFEPFFTTKGLGKGTGLGLATVYGIVKQNQGFIWVDSVLEQGTTFRIYFPRVDEPACVSAPRLPVVAAPHGGETILVVEDDEGIRKMVVLILQVLGYAVLEATRGEEALAAYADRTAPIDLLLTDVVMPGISGPELSRRMLTRFPKLKILYMSGYNDEIIAPHGIMDFEELLLEKPFTSEQLAHKVRQALKGQGGPAGAQP